MIPTILMAAAGLLVAGIGIPFVKVWWEHRRDRRAIEERERAKGAL